MKCNVCGKVDLNDNNNFCTNCGSKLVKEKLNINVEEKKLIYEKVYVVLNLIISMIFIYYLLNGIGLIIAGLLGDLFFGIFIVAFGGEFGMLTAAAIESAGDAVVISIFVSVIMTCFNYGMGIFMYKKNKENLVYGNFGKIGKSKYLLIIYFLGIFGVHKFIIKDKKSGFIRLGLLGAGILIPILYGLNFDIIAEYLIYLWFGSIFGLLISDFIIGVSKQDMVKIN